MANYFVTKQQKLLLEDSQKLATIHKIVLVFIIKVEIVFVNLLLQVYNIVKDSGEITSVIGNPCKMLGILLNNKLKVTFLNVIGGKH